MKNLENQLFKDLCHNISKEAYYKYEVINDYPYLTIPMYLDYRDRSYMEEQAPFIIEELIKKGAIIIGDSYQTKQKLNSILDRITQPGNTIDDKIKEMLTYMITESPIIETYDYAEIPSLTFLFGEYPNILPPLLDKYSSQLNIHNIDELTTYLTETYSELFMEILDYDYSEVYNIILNAEINMDIMLADENDFDTEFGEEVYRYPLTSDHTGKPITQIGRFAQKIGIPQKYLYNTLNGDNPIDTKSIWYNNKTADSIINEMANAGDYTCNTLVLPITMSLIEIMEAYVHSPRIFIPKTIDILGIANYVYGAGSVFDIKLDDPLVPDYITYNSYQWTLVPSGHYGYSLEDVYGSSIYEKLNINWEMLRNKNEPILTKRKEAKKLVTRILPSIESELVTAYQRTSFLPEYAQYILKHKLENDVPLDIVLNIAAEYALKYTALLEMFSNNKDVLLNKIAYRYPKVIQFYIDNVERNLIEDLSYKIYKSRKSQLDNLSLEGYDTDSYSTVDIVDAAYLLNQDVSSYRNY